MPQSPLKSILFFIGSVLVLCYYAFYNHYPLIYDDTGTYIYSGFERFVPIDRPIMYGLFLRHISLGEILWLPVFAQAIMVAFILVNIISLLLPQYSSYKITFFISCILSFFTGISFHVSQLIPDIFTPIAALSLFYILMAPNDKLFIKIIIMLLLIFSILVHNSHLLLLTVLLISITIIYYFTNSVFSINPINLISCWALVIISWFLMPLLHYSFDGEFKISKGSHVFILARMDDNGILKKFLDEKCGEKNYKICQYKDDLSNINLIWSPDSPLHKTGGWEANKEEYNSIIKETLVNPKYLIMHIHKITANTFAQFFDFTTNDASSLRESAPAVQAIKTHFTSEYKQLRYARQMLDRLSFEQLNKNQSFVVLISSLIIVFFASYNSTQQAIPSKLKLFTLLIFLTLFLNSLVVATFSCVVPRYQSRIIWLVPLTAMIYILQFINIEKIKSKIDSYLLMKGNT